MRRRCSKCRKIKDKSEFSLLKSPNRKSWYSSWCKSCVAKANKEYYRNKAKKYDKTCKNCKKNFTTTYSRQKFCCKQCYYKHQKSYSKEWQQKRKIFLVNIMDNRCQKCGYDWRDEGHCVAVLGFHHVNPNEKETRKEWQKKGFETKIEEGKIKLLCSNCHLEEHHSF